MADERLVAALLQQELDAAQRPATMNPNLAAQGQRMNLPARQAPGPFAEFATQAASLDPQPGTLASLLVPATVNPNLMAQVQRAREQQPATSPFKQYNQTYPQTWGQFGANVSNMVNEGLPQQGDPLEARTQKLMNLVMALGPQAQGVVPREGAGRLSDTTVMRPQRNAFPGVYGNPREMVQEAASRVAPEDPLLKQLFGVTRDDIWEISQHGQRQGNLVEQPFKSAANPKGARSAEDVMNPRNERRILDIISESSKVPELHQPMASWYVTDPLFLEYVKQFGKEEAVRRFEKANTLMGMASPASEVLSEINRGSAANWLSTQGRFNDFKKYGGVSNADRGTDFPSDMAGIIPHPYHPTAQAGPMEKYLAAGMVDMNSAKVPTYIQASGVPETGFQTRWPVGDAHWSRIMGLADTRGATTSKGVPTIPGAAATVPEMSTLSNFFRDKIATPSGLEAVPAQGVIWGAGSGATGVTSQIGAGKLELIAKQIGAAARRMNVSPEQARDMIIRGEAHAGFVTPEVAAIVAGGALAGVELAKYLTGEE